MTDFARKVRDGIIIAVSLIAIVVTAVLYSMFASSHIFEESSVHLTEIYRQVNATFLRAVENNRKLMRSWDQYILNTVTIMNDESNPDDAAAREREFIAFIDEQKQNTRWGFTDFYFIGSEHTDNTAEDASNFHNVVECIDSRGNIVDFYTRRSLSALLDVDRGGVVAMRADNHETCMFFGIRNPEDKPNYYKGFEYTSIGITFDTEDMANLLSSQAFGGKAQFYLALPDGNVLLQTNAEHDPVENFFDHFELPDVSVISGGTLEDVRKDWDDTKEIEEGEELQRTATLLMMAHGVESYMTYLPVGFGGWMLVGVVPAAEVNGSMNNFRTMTILIMAVIFGIIVVAVAWIMIMTSRRRVTEKALEVSAREGLLDTLTLSTNDMYFMFSPETLSCEYVSANVLRVLGVDADAVRKNIRNIVTAFGADFKALSDDVLNGLEENGMFEDDVTLHGASGDGEDEYWYHVTLYGSVVNDKKRCIMLFSDRTGDRRMHRNLEEALKIAKDANAAKSNFLSNMSHDIRTPMNAIIGYATLLAKDAGDEAKVREYTHKITYSGQHLLSLINDILDMSKIESGKTSLNIEMFSLPEFIEELFAMMSAQAYAKKQTFDVHTKGNMPEFVMGDKLRLNQVMLNILSNAVKYTPAGGNIELRVETLKQTVRNHVHLKFIVTDNGIGMSQEFLKTIFDPFSREETKETHSIQGTGLGMAITKNILDLMGGIITVESELGKGTTFGVELELAVAEGATEEDEDFWVHHNVTNVLVVDDEEDICMDIKELMADTGVNIDYATNGKRAVQMVTDAVKNKTDYNIVLLDWKMPGMDGLETARRIRAKVGRDLPIMVLTSYSFEDIREEAKEAGIDLFLSKPFFVSNFRRAVMQIRNDGASADIAPENEDVSLEGLRVLAAEDNAINADILEELLDIEGVKCEIAENGEIAVEKFEKSEPGYYDIIFMDIQMPVMDGYEATRAIRAGSHPEAKTVPIIAMTANAFDDDVKAARDAGMNEHCSKPIDMKKLKQIVYRLCSDKLNNRK